MVDHIEIDASEVTVVGRGGDGSRGAGGPPFAPSPFEGLGRRLRNAALIALVEGLVAVIVFHGTSVLIPMFAAALVAAGAIALYRGWGRKSSSARVRGATWVFAAAQTMLALIGPAILLMALVASLILLVAGLILLMVLIAAVFAFFSRRS